MKLHVAVDRSFQYNRQHCQQALLKHCESKLFETYLSFYSFSRSVSCSVLKKGLAVPKICQEQLFLSVAIFSSYMKNTCISFYQKIKVNLVLSSFMIFDRAMPLYLEKNFRSLTLGALNSNCKHML